METSEEHTLKRARVDNNDNPNQLRKELEQKLSEEQLEEAARMARIAARAEERALEKARLRKLEQSREKIPTHHSSSMMSTTQDSIRSKGGMESDVSLPVPKFKSKKEREREAMMRLEERRKEEQEKAAKLAKARQDFIQSQRPSQSQHNTQRSHDRRDWKNNNNNRRGRQGDREVNRDARNQSNQGNKDSTQTDTLLLEEIKKQYMGHQQYTQRSKRTEKRPAKKSFKFEWDASDDTSSDLNPLYSQKAQGSILFGRGYHGGVDKRDQRSGADYALELMKRRSNGTVSKEALENKRSELETKERLRIRKEEPVEINWRDKSLADMTKRDWRIVREDFDIHVHGSRIPNPARNWDEMGLPDYILRAVDELGFTKPTPIQMQTIPIGLCQRDVIGVAATGSGKTASFVIPMLVYFMKQDPKKLELCAEDGPLAVIMAPTRELALQIEEHTVKLAKNTNIKTVSVIGGNSIQEQGFRLREGCQVVVATPGRLLDCLENHYVVFNQCGYLVLDEADKMIDMGFEPQVEAVISAMSCSMKSDVEREVIEQEKLASEGKELFRITIMFSATMRPEVESLAKRYMRFPAIVKIGDEDTGKNRDIKQQVYMVKGGESGKKSKLVNLVRSTKPPVLVFANAKRTCDMVARYLQRVGVQAAVLHSGLSQERREANLRDFKEGVHQALVATDVAGRGLDMLINHVVNYDMATDIERYTHRIGRTGRAGRSGLASTLLTESDNQMFYPLVQYLKSTESEIPSDLSKHPMSSVKPGDHVDPKLMKRYENRT